ncbi:MAG TPA: prepilin-type N-terminal cleavage/methylation domain-containing protein [Planctomycetota bacterium]|nr:prepilin-type N-terminal cleavage/methylation domain-containing protein [Planctomycetota bacterium]
MRRRAYTLIELMIATALGLTICAAAYACVRLCAQVSSTTARLSDENRLLRAGYLAALDEVDFWTSVDDPGDATRQKLRSAGRPFHPLRFVAPAPGAPTAPGDLVLSPDQSHPEAAFRGLPIRNDAVANEYGRYELVAASGGTAPNQRQARLLNQVFDRLGFYALFSYAPANTIYSSVDETGATPSIWSRYVTGPYHVSTNEGVCAPRDFTCLSNGAIYQVTTHPSVVDADGNKARFDVWNSIGQAWPDPWTAAGFAGSEELIAPMPLRPSHWPALALAVRRVCATFRRANQVSLTVRSPVSGEAIKLNWIVAGTTLRGARRQRDAVAGWKVAGRPSLDE